MRIGITTSRRHEAEYLRETVGAIRAQLRPGDSIVLAPTFRDDPLADGCQVLPPLFPGTKDEVRAAHGDHRGLELNTDRLYTHLALANEWFLVLQDDVEPCRNFIQRVHDTRAYVTRSAASCGAVSFYTPYDQCRDSPCAIWSYKPRAFYGELAMLWSPAAALAFVRESDPREAHDLMIQRWFGSQHRFRLLAHSPCLVQHTGERSATDKADGRRTTQGYRGKSYDAVTQAKPWP